MFSSTSVAHWSRYTIGASTKETSTCKVPKSPPKPSGTWPLDVIAKDPEGKFLNIFLQVDHNKHKSVPAGIQYTAEIDLEPDGLSVLYLLNDPRDDKSPVLGFYYTIYYQGKPPIIVDNSGLGTCYLFLNYTVKQYPTKVTLSRY